MFPSERLPLAERYAELLADRRGRARPDRPARGARLWERHLLNCAVLAEADPAGRHGLRRRLRRRPARPGAGDRPPGPARSPWSSRCCGGPRSSRRWSPSSGSSQVEVRARPGRGAARRSARSTSSPPGPWRRWTGCWAGRCRWWRPTGALLAMKGSVARPRRSRPRPRRCAGSACAAPEVLDAGRGRLRHWLVRAAGPIRVAGSAPATVGRRGAARQTARGRQAGAVVERQPRPTRLARPSADRPELSTGLGWPAERSYPQVDAGSSTGRAPTERPVVSRETSQASPRFTCIRTAGVRTAGELAPRTGASTTTATPLARAAEHSLLARQGARMRPPLPRPDAHPGDRGRQPEGRRRQDHHHGERRRRAGPARAAGAGDRPRPAGQRLHGARRRAPPRRAVDLRRCWSTARRSPTSSRRARTSPDLFVVPATIDLAGAEIELVSVVARESRLHKAIQGHPAGRRPPRTAGEDRFDYVLHRLPAVAGPAHAERAGRRRGDADPDPGGVLRARGPRPAARDRGDGARSTSTRDLAVSTILVTMYDARTRLAAGVAEEVREHFGDQVLQDHDPALGAGLRGAVVRPDA